MNLVYNHDRTTSQNHAHFLRTRADTHTLALLPQWASNNSCCEWLRFVYDQNLWKLNFRAIILKRFSVHIENSLFHRDDLNNTDNIGFPFFGGYKEIQYCIIIIIIILLLLLINIIIISIINITINIYSQTLCVCVWGGGGGFPLLLMISFSLTYHILIKYVCPPPPPPPPPKWILVQTQTHVPENICMLLHDLYGFPPVTSWDHLLGTMLESLASRLELPVGLGLHGVSAFLQNLVHLHSCKSGQKKIIERIIILCNL